MITDRDFENLVAEDVRGKVSDEQREYLRVPDRRDRWREALAGLHTKLDGQLERLDDRERLARARSDSPDAGMGDARVEELAELEGRRGKVNRFMFFVDQRIVEAAAPAGAGDDPARVRAARLALLERAITTHRSLLTDGDVEPTVADQALWDALRGEWKFGGLTPEMMRTTDGTSRTSPGG
jgi:hypothetical protein